MARLPNERREPLAVQAEATDWRIAKLEDELSSANEKLAILENQNHSLQTSLDLIVSENLRLSRCLTESEARVDKARSQIDRIRTVLKAAEAERRMLRAKIDARNEGPELLPGRLAAKEHQIQEICSKPIGNSTQTLLASTIKF